MSKSQKTEKLWSLKYTDPGFRYGSPNHRSKAARHNPGTSPGLALFGEGQKMQLNRGPSFLVEASLKPGYAQYNISSCLAEQRMRKMSQPSKALQIVWYLLMYNGVKSKIRIIFCFVLKWLFYLISSSLIKVPDIW